MVPSGRTDALIGANDAPSVELSYGHDLKGIPLHGASEWELSFLYGKSGS